MADGMTDDELQLLVNSYKGHQPEMSETEFETRSGASPVCAYFKR